MDSIITGYQLTKAFYRLVGDSEEIQKAVRSHHQSLYTWICELRNRIQVYDQKAEVLDLPRDYTMKMSFIGSPTTLEKCIEDLAKWGVIEILFKGKNQWSGPTKVKIASSFMNKHCTCTEPARYEHDTSTERALNTIKTEETDKTKKERVYAPFTAVPVEHALVLTVTGQLFSQWLKANPPKKPKAVKSPKVESPLEYPKFATEQFKLVWMKLVAQPKWKKKSPDQLQYSLNRMSGFDEAFCIELMERTIENNWTGVVFTETAVEFQKYKDRPPISTKIPPPQQYETYDDLLTPEARERMSRPATAKQQFSWMHG